MCEFGVFPHFVREQSFKSQQNPRADFFLRQEKTRKDSKRRFSISCSRVLCSMDCLQLSFIGVEEAVSWTQRFLTRKFGQKSRFFFLWQTNLKANVSKNSTFQVIREKNRKTASYREQSSRHFSQHFMRTTTQQTLLAINLASRQKTIKLYFSSQVRKQFKLLTVPSKPLRCCLRWQTCELPCFKNSAIIF